jgi:hypothetical protein
MKTSRLVTCELLAISSSLPIFDQPLSSNKVKDALQIERIEYEDNQALVNYLYSFFGRGSLGHTAETANGIIEILSSRMGVRISDKPSNISLTPFLLCQHDYMEVTEVSIKLGSKIISVHVYTNCGFCAPIEKYSLEIFSNAVKIAYQQLLDQTSMSPKNIVINTLLYYVFCNAKEYIESAKATNGISTDIWGEFSGIAYRSDGFGHSYLDIDALLDTLLKTRLLVASDRAPQVQLV